MSKFKIGISDNGTPQPDEDLDAKSLLVCNLMTG